MRPPHWAASASFPCSCGALRGRSFFPGLFRMHRCGAGFSSGHSSEGKLVEDCQGLLRKTLDQLQHLRQQESQPQPQRQQPTAATAATASAVAVAADPAIAPPSLEADLHPALFDAKTLGSRV